MRQILLVVIPLFLMTFLSPASASVIDAKVSEAHASAAQFEADLALTAGDLQGIPTAEWNATVVERYLDQALSAIYYAKVAANWNSPADAAQTDADLSKLVELGYLKAWPANPLRDWAPMQTRTLADGFSAGDLVLQTAPASHYSKLHGQLYAASFCLGVYGAAPVADDAAALSYPARSEMFEWARSPKGALFVKSMWVQSHASVQARKQWQKERDNKAKDSAR